MPKRSASWRQGRDHRRRPGWRHLRDPRVRAQKLVYGLEYSEILANAASYGWSVGSSDCNSSVLLENVRQEVDRLNGIHIKTLANAGVELIAIGQFVDDHTVRVGDRQFTARQIMRL